MASAAEGAIVAAALRGAEAEAAASGKPGCRLPPRLDLGIHWRVFMGGHRGRGDEDGSGIGFLFSWII